MARSILAVVSCGVLWFSAGCPSASTKAPREAAPPPVPATVAPEPEPASEPEPRCDPSRLEDFECYADARCSEVDREDASIDLTEFLCLAREASSADGSLAAIMRRTPIAFRKNFTAKHGVARVGERGHAYEELRDFLSAEIVDNGQSASPLSPRTLVWDEATGFSISYNGDAPNQTGGGRLDLMRFDAERERFELWALDLPARAPIRPEQPKTPTDDCDHCHGPHGRPIWPMYPDWPGFFGSDNDELTSDSASAVAERALWAAFRECAVDPAAHADCTQTPRFAGLFDDALEEGLRASWPTQSLSSIATYAAEHPRNMPPGTTAAIFDGVATTRDWLGLKIHPSFPFRPDHSQSTAAPSRAFFHRPNLRLGVLYNRLLARALMAELRRDPIFAEFERYVALTVMDCGWDGETELRASVQRRFGEATADRLRPLGLSIEPDTVVRHPLLLTALGSSVRDVDMRFSHSNPAYAPLDATADEPLAPGPMDVGFIEYGDRDLHAVAGSKAYFNSYFDGTATFDELWVARMLDHLVEDDPALAAVYQPNDLTTKYARFTPRMALDEIFFAQMDALGSWMPLPYPRHLRHLHDREPFHKRKGGRKRFIEPYLAVCRELRRGLQASVNP